MPLQTPTGHPRLLPITALLCSALAFYTAVPRPALAQATASHAETVFDIQLAAQPLGSALHELSKQTGIQIFAAGDLVSEQRQAPTVTGRFSVSQALGRLLAGSRLTFQQNGEHGYAIIPADATQLDAVTISGKASGSTTEGTGSYTTWSTSSSTRLNLTPQETPQAITVLTRQRLDDQKLETLVDALDATPGIIVQRTFVGQGQDSSDIYARGSYLQNYQIDGVPTSLAVGPFLANTAAYDRIEIVRGATGIMNGLGTPAATVNLIRKRPTATPQISMTAQAGNWQRHGFGLDVSNALNESGTARARLVADYNKQGAWVDRFDQKNIALYGIGELDLSDRTLLTIGFNHLSQRTDSTIVGYPIFFTNGERIPLSPADNGTPDWNYYDNALNSFFASVEHRFESGWVSKIEYSQARYRDDAVTQSITDSIDAGTGNGMELWPFHWRTQNRQENLDAYVSGAFSLFGREHELIAGVTLSRERARTHRYEDDWMNYPADFNIFDWAATAPTPTFFKTGESDSRERQYSAYLNARFQLSDAASLLLGGRSTHWKRTQASTPTERKENVFVPYVGLVYALNDTWSVYGSYTKIFQPQDGRVFIYNAPGTSPDPEQGEGYETGIKADFYDGRLTSSLALFQMDISNLAVWNSDAYIYDIHGKTRTRGVELELNGELAEGWQASAGYAYARTEDAQGERTLTRLPLHSIKLFTTYRLPGAWNRLTLGGGINWQSAISSNSTFDYRQGDVTLVNLMARYDISKHLSAALHVNNLLDKRYFSTVSSNYGTYGAPRSFILSAKYSF